MASTIKVDNVQNQPGTNIVSKCSTTITLGQSGDTVALACGASQTGFGSPGQLVDWQTGSIKTATFTAADGEGYFCNTTGGAFEVDLPAGAAGSIVSIQDYANKFATNNLTIDPNGSEVINGGSAGAPIVLETNGQGVTFVYVDGTVGWRSVNESQYATAGSEFIVATVSGACNTLGIAPDCSDVKLATFTGPGTFCVTHVSTTCGARNIVGYAVIAGGASGGAGGNSGGGGAGGGFREGRNVPMDNFTASPLVADYPGPNCNAVTLTASPYPITVGAGGTAVTGASAPGVSGSNSIFSCITSAGGGGGGGVSTDTGIPGGSGGGGAGSGTGNPGGTGNTPPTTPSQGFGGGCSTGSPGNNGKGGGGGGAGAVGSTGGASPGDSAGTGGVGVPTSVSGSGVSYSGGAGGGAQNGPPVGANSGYASPCGTGGRGGASGRPAGDFNADPGTTNRGGGGGGNAGTSPPAPSEDSGSGGSGIVYIRYKFQ